MEKIFKTDNGEIKLERENNAVKISQGGICQKKF